MATRALPPNAQQGRGHPLPHRTRGYRAALATHTAFCTASNPVGCSPRSRNRLPIVPQIAHCPRVWGALLHWSALGLTEAAWSPSHRRVDPRRPAQGGVRRLHTAVGGLWEKAPRSADIQARPRMGGGHQLRDGHPPSDPEAASGTLNSPCGVLCTVRSLYLYAIGLNPVSKPCEGWTSHFKLQFQEALLAGERRAIPCPVGGPRLHGAVTLSRTPFQATSDSSSTPRPQRVHQDDPASHHPAYPPVGAAHSLPPACGGFGGCRTARGWVTWAPVHSPLLGQPRLLFVPPPTDMLKLGRSLCAPSGDDVSETISSDPIRLRLRLPRGSHT